MTHENTFDALLSIEPPSARKVLGFLNKKITFEIHVYLTQREISEELKMDIRTVREALKKLEDMGIILRNGTKDILINPQYISAACNKYEYQEWMRFFEGQYESKNKRKFSDKEKSLSEIGDSTNMQNFDPTGSDD